MGVPVAPSLRPIPRTAAAEAPPPPEAGFFEGLMPNVRVAQDVVPFYQPDRLTEAYEPLIEAMSEVTGRNRDAYKTQNWWRYDPLHPWDYAKVWRDIEALPPAARAKLKLRGETREAFDQDVVTRGAEGRADREVAERSGTATQLIGGMAGAMTDPATFLTLPVGGFGRTVGMKILTEGLTQMGLTGLQTPQNIAARKTAGVETGAADVALEIGFAGAGGVAFRGIAEGAAPAFERAVAANWERIPEPLRQRWAARAQLPEQEANALAADVAEAAIGRGNMSEAERDAADVIRREAEIDGGSPFVPNGAAAELHPALLGEALGRLLDTAPRARLAMPAAGSAARPVVPRIGSGSVYGGSRGIDLDAALGFIVDSLEGGARSNVDSGGLTKFGISSKGNPDIDVGNLTRDKAMALYRQRYAAQLELDKLPGDMALVALDAAINHGPAFARGLVRGARSVAEMLGRRRTEYARLIREDPGKYGRYEKGWENRLQRIEARLGRRPGEAGPIVRDDFGGDERARIQADLEEVTARADALAAAQRAARAGEPDPWAEVMDTGAPGVSERQAQFELDRSFYGEPEAAAAVWRRSGVLADMEEGGVRAEQVRAAIGDEAADRLEAAATGFREGRVSEADALAALDDDALARIERFDAATANPSEREGYFLTPEGEERSLAEVVADLDQGDLPLAVGAPVRAASAPAAGKVLQVIETDTGRVVETFREGVSRADAEDFAKRASQWTGPVGKAKTKYHVGEAAAAPAPAAIKRQQSADREALAAWDDPAGPAAQAQADSVLHDLKAMVLRQAQDQPGSGEVAVQLDGEGEARALAALLDDIDEDFAMVAALKGCMT